MSGSGGHLAAVALEIVELREMLQKETAEAAERVHTVSGRRKAMTFLATLYRHSVENLTLADRASERCDRDAAIVLGEMQGIIDDVIIRLEEVLATPPVSSRARRGSAHQPGVGT